MIDAYSFGAIVVSGRKYHRDIKILRSRVIPDWRRAKGHRVGLEDIRDILDDPPDILVIGKGYFGLMKPEEEVHNAVASLGICLIEENTREAAKRFNECLREGKSVAAAFHLTC